MKGIKKIEFSLSQKEKQQLIKKGDKQTGQTSSFSNQTILEENSLGTSKSSSSKPDNAFKTNTQNLTLSNSELFATQKDALIKISSSQNELELNDD